MPECMVNHEMEQGVVMAAITQNAELEVMLGRTVAALRHAMRDTSWSDAEGLVEEAEALLERAR